MLKQLRWVEYGELALLFFLQWMAMGIWFVPLSPVLDAHGLQSIKSYAFATFAVGSLVSPLIFGAMADRHVAPVTVLRFLTLASGAAMTLTTWSIQHGWAPGAVLALIQLQMLCSTPIVSISTTIVFSRLRDPHRQFGPIRATATFGWMCGCWLVSALNADTTPLAGYSGAVIWLLLSGFTFLLPAVPPPPVNGHVSIRERMGWDALVLLKNRDHKVVFITAALFNIPLSAFYPFTPAHLQHLGFQHTSAWMSVGQVSEIFAMFCLAGLITNWRLKWVFAAGLSFGVLRYAACALDTRWALLLGISMHGLAYALYFTTAQIYLEQRIDPAWRARAQALFSLMTSGVGNLIGYLGCGAWYAACAFNGGTRWTMFWAGLSAAIACVFFYFLIIYRGQKSGGSKGHIAVNDPSLQAK